MIGQQGSLGVSPAELLAAKNMASGKSDMNKEIALGGDLTRLMLAAMQLKKTQAELEKLKLTQGANPQTTVAQDVQQGIAQLQGQGQQSEEQPQGQPPQQMAQMDVFQWNELNALFLPGGVGIVCTDNTPNDGTPGVPACDGLPNSNYVVKIWWNERVADGSLQRFITVFKP